VRRADNLHVPIVLKSGSFNLLDPSGPVMGLLYLYLTNYRGISYLPTTYKILSNILLSMLTPYAEDMFGIISVDFNTTGQLLIVYAAFVRYWKGNGNKVNQCFSCLWTSRKFMIQLG
jgi:hypothetical protein